MKIRIHKEGYLIILIFSFVVILITILINLIWPNQTIIHYLLYLAGLLFILFIIAFFRNPERRLVQDENLIISGADGKVVVIEEVEENEFLNDRRIQISVYMSSRNVHVNRYPVSGKVIYKKHHSGSFVLARKAKSSHHNERTTVVVENPVFGNILFRQIAGVVAKRIICNAEPGDIVTQGDELGMIRFGSRFDFFLPNDVKVNVKLGQNVRANKTIIATKV